MNQNEKKIIVGLNHQSSDAIGSSYAPQNKPQEQSWEIEFEKEFGHLGELWNGKKGTQEELEVKSFIRSLLQTQRAEILDKIKNNEICTNCGNDKDSELSDWCKSCLENE